MGAMVIRTGQLTESAYRSVHQWVQRKLGTPNECEACGSTDTRLYEWANISGQYRREVADWKRMCRSCHRLMDQGIKRLAPSFFQESCSNGHRLTIDNIYLRRYKHQPTWRGIIECRTCRALAMRRYKEAHA